MSVGPILLGLLALLLVAANLAYSVLSLTCYRLRERRYPVQLPLGIPMLGSALALTAGAWMFAQSGQGWIAWLVLADTGGPLGWIVAVIWQRAHAPRLPEAAPRLHGLSQDRASGVR